MANIYGVKVNFDLDKIQSENGKKNVDTILKFFSLYLKDREAFYALWDEKEPIVFLPFPAADVAVCQQSALTGWEAVKSFWNPIFDWTGQFDWTVNEAIVSEDGNTIVTKSNSRINTDTTEAFGCVHLDYVGTYVQIFKFKNGKIKSFEELYDTEFLNSQYKK